MNGFRLERDGIKQLDKGGMGKRRLLQVGNHIMEDDHACFFCSPQLPVTDKMAVRLAIPESILSVNVSGRTRCLFLIYGLCISYDS